MVRLAAPHIASFASALALASGLVLGCNDAAAPPAGVDDTGGADAGATPDPNPGATRTPTSPSLDPELVLIRASLDLRGIRPTVDELEGLRADPESLDARIDAYVDHPGFGPRIKAMFAGAWRTRVDEYPLPPELDYDETAEQFYAAVSEEPLNLIAFVAENDRPFTDVVLAPHTFVDPLLLDLWPLEEVSGEGEAPGGTIRARYTDGRPVRGVLSQNAVYWRHGSTLENANRGRANAISQALLCQSYLDRPIEFPTDLDLTDSESIQNAIAENEACQACHATMDPLASYLWGFMYAGDQPSARYAVEFERGWQQYSGVAPGFFGKPGERLQDLGDQIAGDERFVSCAVRRVYEGLMGRSVALQDEGALAEHREAFLSGELTLRALVRSIVRDPSYRGAHWSPRFGGSPAPVIRKVAPVDVLASSLADLSGFRLQTYGGREAITLDRGLRRLAGGSDKGDAQAISTGAVLVQRRLADGGAIFAVEAAADGERRGRVGARLEDIDLDAGPTTDDLVALIETLRSSRPSADAEEVTVLLDVWHDVDAISNPREAWIAVVTALLADPDHLIY